MKFLFPIFISVLLFITSCSPALLPGMAWQSEQVSVDGKMNEWPNPLRFYDSKSKINYTITNNNKKVFICMKIPDESTQFRIMYAGMEFSIDTAGKKKFPVSINFPVGNEAGMHEESLSDKKYIAGSDVAFVKQKFLSMAKEIEVKGFKPPVKGFIPLHNNFGIEASLNWDKSGILVYEAAIPFAVFYKDELSPADSGRFFSYKIKINAMPEEKGTENRNNSQTNNTGTDFTGSGIPGSGSIGANSQTYRSNTNDNVMHENPTGEPVEIVNKLRFSFR